MSKKRKEKRVKKKTSGTSYNKAAAKSKKAKKQPQD